MSAVVRVNDIQLVTSTPPAQRRTSVTYDGTGTTTSSFAIPIPSLVQDGDFGVVLLGWVAPSEGAPLTTLSAPGWSTVVAPTVAGGICVAVLSRRFVAGDTSLAFSLGAGRQLAAIGAWYPGISAVDTVGTLALNPGTVSNTVSAPGISGNSTSGDEMLALFVKSIRGTPAQVQSLNLIVPGDSVASEDLEWVATVNGSVNTLFLGMTDWPQWAETVDNLAPTATLTPVFNVSTSYAAGVQLALLPYTSPLGAEIQLGPSVAMTAKSTVIAPASFAATVSLTAVGYPSGSAAFTPSVAFGAVGTAIVSSPASLSTAIALTATGCPSSNATLGASVTLAATGLLLAASAASLGAQVTLSAVGSIHANGAVSWGASVALGAVGAPSVSSPATLSTSVSLTAVGSALCAAAVTFGADVQFGIIEVIPALQGSAQFACGMQLAARLGKVLVVAPASFGPNVALSAAGIPNLTPVGLAKLTATVTLAATGFAPEEPPVGITLKSVPVQPEPLIAAGAASKTWSVSL